MNHTIFKRIMPLALVILMLPAMLAVPARADVVSDANSLVNYLDYGYLFGSSNYALIEPSVGLSYVRLSLPDVNAIYYVDIILHTDSTTLIVSKWGDGNPALTKVSLGDGYYRFFGDVSREYLNPDLYFLYSDGSFIDVQSMKVSLNPLDGLYPRNVSGTVFDYSASPAKQSSIYYDGTGAGNVVTITPPSYDSEYWVSSMNIQNWNSMDYVQFTFFAWTTSISSIDVSCGQLSVPYTVNYIENSINNGSALYIIDLVIDVTDLRRDSGLPVLVEIAGVTSAGKTASVNIVSCYGFLVVEPPSLWTHWFTQVGTWLSQQTNSIVSAFNSGVSSVGSWITDQTTRLNNSLSSGFLTITTYISNQTTAITTWGQNIVNALTPDADTDSFDDGVSDAKDTLDNASDAMNDFTRPDPDSVVPTIDIQIDSGVGDVFDIIINNDICTPILSGSLAIWLVCLILGI